MNIASVPYLNAVPLIRWFACHSHSGIELTFATPSRLIEQLLSGEVDMAMTSTFAVLQHPSLHLLSNLGVTASGRVLSVRLFSTVPIDSIRTLALDCSSRSSVTMARIILADRYGIQPLILSRAPDLGCMLAEADAAVLIGDLGLTATGEGVFTIDLGEEWWKLTQRPFYYAGWISRDEDLLEHYAPLLHEACEYGMDHLSEISAGESRSRNIAPLLCHQYLTEVLRYHAGDAERAGLEEMRLRAARLELLAV